MAHVTGTATNHADLFNKIRDTCVTNAALVAAGQAWTELRYIKDNFESSTTDMSFAAGQSLDRMFRGEDISFSGGSAKYTTTFNNAAAGKSFSWKLRVAADVTFFKLQINLTSQTMTAFRLQYSDDNSTWTTAYTATGLSWPVNSEERTFTIGTATGSHLYWRILVDTVNNVQLLLDTLRLYNVSGLISSSRGELLLKGPGLSGLDNIYVGFSTWSNPVLGVYLIQVHGFTGTSSAMRSMLTQPGYSTNGIPAITTWNNSIPYWITVSGRRIIIVTKTSGVYDAAYAGFFLPYATPAQYPYPLMIGGSISSGAGEMKYDATGSQHSVFCIPGGEDGRQSVGVSSLYTNFCTAIMQPTGVWEGYSQRNTASPEAQGIVQDHCILPGAYGLNQSKIPMWEAEGGGYQMQPHIIYNWSPKPSRYLGEIDGTQFISGSNNTSENTGTFAGKNYVVFANTYRTAVSEYFAIEAQ